MKKYYHDFYGASASIEIHRDGKATLRTYCAGIRTKKTYKTFRGARIAMGKMSDAWFENK